MAKEKQELSNSLFVSMKMTQAERIVDAFLYLIDLLKKSDIEKDPTANRITCLMDFMKDCPMDEEDRKMFDEISKRVNTMTRPI